MSITTVLPEDFLITGCTSQPPVALRIEPWTQAHFTRWGYDPRSAYSERFHLPLVGPSCVWLARNVAYGFETFPDGYLIDARTQAELIGIGHPALKRCFARLVSFGLAHNVGNDHWALRTHWAPVGPAALAHMPDPLRETHGDWEAAFQHESRDERDARAMWRFTVRLHANATSLPDIDTALRQAACEPTLRVELIEWAKATPRYGRPRLDLRTPDA